MSKKRVTLDEDYARFSENLDLNEGVPIVDKDSFDKAFDAYMEGTPHAPEFKEKAWQHYSQQKNLVEKYKPEEFRKTHPKRKLTKKELKARKAVTVTQVPVAAFEHLAKVKGKTVYARQTTNKTGQKVLRDRKGRFAKAIRR